MSNPFAQQAPPPPLAQNQQQAPAPQAGPPAFHGPNKGGGSAVTQDDWQGFIGHLVLFEVFELQKDVETKNGKADAILADIHVIDLPDQPRYIDRAFVFPPALVTATREVRDENGHLVVSAGDKPYYVLGRLAAYTTKAGRDTFQLTDHSDTDAKTATDYIAWHRQQAMNAPPPQQAQAAPQAGPPTQDPWANQQPAATEQPPF